MSKDNLIERSQGIKNETSRKSITAIRVGSLFEDIVIDTYSISGSLESHINTVSGSLSNTIDIVSGSFSSSLSNVSSSLESRIDTVSGSIKTDLDNLDNDIISTSSSLSTHIEDESIHFSQSQISITESQVSDLDKYTQSEVDTLVGSGGGVFKPTGSFYSTTNDLQVTGSVSTSGSINTLGASVDTQLDTEFVALGSQIEFDFNEFDFVGDFSVSGSSTFDGSVTVDGIGDLTTFSGSVSNDITEIENQISNTTHGKLVFLDDGNPETISLSLGVPERITNSDNNLYQERLAINTEKVDDRLVINNSGLYRIYAMISFEGKQGSTYNLSIRKQSGVTEDNLCNCNPKIQLPANNRIVLLNTTDIGEFQAGDAVSLWIEDENAGETILLYTSKIVVTRIF